METFLGSLPTEQINKKTMHIDMCSTVEMLEMINDEDSKVSLAVRKEIPHIAQAVDVITERIKRGGRLFYVGAGTSGRIGILDASECPPTFGTDPELVQGIIAGGSDAMYKAVEGAEDNEEMGVNVIREKKVTERDVIVGISASGRTP
ncbi:MAG: N-acetylmuramic acid 6-phosphate etherase, partial [Peptococcales bacterium]